MASSVGDQFTRIALFPKVGGVGGTLTWLVALALAQSIPPMLVSPYAGYLADRGRRRDYLIGSDLARAVLLACIAFIGSLPLIIVGTTAVALFSAIFRPIEASLEAELLPKEEIVKANALRVSASQVLTILGPALAGATLIWLPATKVLLIDALSFVASALVLATLPRDGATQPLQLHVESGRVTGERTTIRQGVQYIMGRNDLKTLFITVGIVTAILSMQNPLFYNFVQRTLSQDGPVYGLFISALGVGGLLASAVMLRHRGTIALTLLIATLCFDGFALLGFTYSRNILLSAALMAAMGAIGSVFAIAIRSYLQMYTAADIRGRVIGWFSALQSPIEAASLTIGLLIATRFPAWLILRAGAIAEIVVSVLAILVLAFSGLRIIRPTDKSIVETAGAKEG